MLLSTTFIRESYQFTVVNFMTHPSKHQYILLEEFPKKTSQITQPFLIK